MCRNLFPVLHYRALRSVQERKEGKEKKTEGKKVRRRNKGKKRKETREKEKVRRKGKKREGKLE